ncbi:LIM homeobox transcription factor 1-beta-like [Lampetra fluviatilis]
MRDRSAMEKPRTVSTRDGPAEAHTGDPAVCQGCSRPISDRFLLRADGALWHERCLHCCCCLEPLTHLCYCRDRRLYCKRDYHRLFSARCPACSRPISPSERVLRAPLSGRPFHVRCFRCALCRRTLRTGDRFLLLRDGSPACSGHGGGGATGQEADRAGIRRRAPPPLTEPRRSIGASSTRLKRPRTILTPQQRRAFKASFEMSSKPSRKVREMLAAETGLNVRVVQVWFQNQRAKMKKLARRQQQNQLQQLDGAEWLWSERRERRGPERGRRDSPVSAAVRMEERAGVGGSRRDETPFPPAEPFGEGLTPPLLPGDHLHPYGHASYFHCGGDRKPPHCIVGHAEPLPPAAAPARAKLGNPIEHLYSMQSAYFTS